MQPPTINKYIDWRRGIFDIKSDCLPSSVVMDAELIHRASLCLGDTTEPIPVCNGTFHSIYSFEFKNNPFILRVFNSKDIHGYHFHIEDWISKTVSENAVPSSKSEFTDTSRYSVPFDYQILNQVKGHSPANFNDSMIKKCFSKLASKLARVHQISMSKYGPLDPKPLFFRAPSSPQGLFDSWGDYLTLKAQEHMDICRDINAIDESEYSEISRLLKSLRHFDDFSPVLLHGDLGNHNIMVKDEDTITIIDWENALAGDPVYDLAQWCAFHMPDRFDWITEAYYHHASKPKDFYVRFWTYYLRIVLARTVYRHNFKRVDNPKYPAASKRIQLALQKLS